MDKHHRHSASQPPEVTCGHPEHRLRTICAWCLANIVDGAEPTSHGICTACSEYLLRQMEEVRFDT